jgi:hypothetical protein
MELMKENWVRSRYVCIVLEEQSTMFNENEEDYFFERSPYHDRSIAARPH